MLFDLENDPDEYVDLGEDAAFEDVRLRMQEALNRWGLRWSQRTTISDEAMVKRRGGAVNKGILIGYWDIDDVSDDKRAAIRDILVARPSGRTEGSQD